MDLIALHAPNRSGRGREDRRLNFYTAWDNLARRRGRHPDALADELLRADLSGAGEQDLEAALQDLAELRAGLPEIDEAVLARDAREQLERRGGIRDDAAVSGAS